MTLRRMDNVLIVVEDLEAATAFFRELGMEVEGVGRAARKALNRSVSSLPRPKTCDRTTNHWVGARAAIDKPEPHGQSRNLGQYQRCEQAPTMYRHCSHACPALPLLVQSGSPEPVRFLDHAGFAVGDYDTSKAFYEKALAPLGITLMMEPSGEAAGFGRDGRPFFWVEARGQPVRGRLHIAFVAADRDEVDAFHSAALQAGGADNGAPGTREIYHPHYYGAYVLDPDGNNIEAVCHKPV